MCWETWHLLNKLIPRYELNLFIAVEPLLSVSLSNGKGVCMKLDCAAARECGPRQTENSFRHGVGRLRLRRQTLDHSTTPRRETAWCWLFQCVIVPTLFVKRPTSCISQWWSQCPIEKCFFALKRQHLVTILKLYLRRLATKIVRMEMQIMKATISGLVSDCTIGCRI